VQEQRRVCDQQEKQDVVQGVPAAQMSGGGHVQERVTVRPAIQLVQDPLPAPGTAAAPSTPQQQQPAPTAATPAPATATLASATTTTPVVRGPAFPATVGGRLQNVAGPRPHASASADVGRRQTSSAPGRGQQQLRGR